MVELVECVKHREWIHLFKKHVPSMFEKEVRDLFYAIKFKKYRMSLSAMV